MFNNDGQVATRAQLVANFKSGAYKFESLTLRNASIHVFDDTAVASLVGDIVKYMLLS